MAIIDPSTEDSQKLKKRLELFEQAYKLEKVKALKSEIMEEIINLRQRLGISPTIMVPAKIISHPSSETPKKLTSSTESIVSRNQKLALLMLIRQELPTLKIKLKQIRELKISEYNWAAKRISDKTNPKREGAARWCLEKKVNQKIPHHAKQSKITPEYLEQAAKKTKWAFAESTLEHSQDIDIVYIDAGTVNNGQKGKQRTTIAAFDENGTKIFVEEIGDLTNNEGEISAIVRALEISIRLKRAFKICSDSQVALGWAQSGKAGKNLVNQQVLARKAKKLLTESRSALQWVPREYNKAGHYLEAEYNI